MIQKNSGVVFFVLGTKKIVKVVGGKIRNYFCIKSCPVKVLSYHRGGEAAYINHIGQRERLTLK
jgi:hypothetical protein